MTEAKRRGYHPTDQGWTNLGQGQPETSELSGAPERIRHIAIDDDDQEYGPVAGVWELREAVADYYNRTYRRGMPSQYSAENVCISAGGRLALTRAVSALGNIHLGHFLPDYTAYEEVLEVFRLFTPIPILLEPHRGYDFSIEELRREILGRGLSALLLSNPCNPTGKLIAGGSLAGWVSTARRLDCALILDEFYSHYIWDDTLGHDLNQVSAARYVDDVDKDPVVILDGLTKNWRYPGWRIAWTVGPRRVIEKLASAGSFLDGGAPRPLQRAAIPLLEDSHAVAETRAIQREFRKKRSVLLSRLASTGITVDVVPGGTFYIWGNLQALPASINTGMDFFRRALEYQVICVPGQFFDINPGKRRTRRSGRFSSHIRLSFGPSLELIEAGLDRLTTMIAEAPDEPLQDKGVPS